MLQAKQTVAAPPRTQWSENGPDFNALIPPDGSCFSPSLTEGMTTQDQLIANPGCDVVAIRVEDLAARGYTADRASGDDIGKRKPVVRRAIQCQNPWMQIREARAEDAPAACIVSKRSIAELCAADHRNDPSILARWLGNKTHENFCAWVKQPDNSVIVAVENEDIIAVGSVTDAGMIGLNYVLPDARFQGVSRALLRALEVRAAERGNKRCGLTSTETARRFYLSMG